MSYRIGVDIGGTFTDLVFVSDQGAISAAKVASTPHDYSEAVLSGIRAGLADLSVDPSEVREISHGFTIATNAILEGKGAKTALVTTEGFRDVLEFRRNRVPRLYDLYYEKPPALVKRNLRFEVAERMDASGNVLRPLDARQVKEIALKLVEQDVQSVVVCFLHSYANPAHEQEAAAILAEHAPNVTRTLSSELLPIIKEYERTSSTVINGYVRPVVETYLNKLIRGLAEVGIDTPVGVMQSNGGLATVGAACERPAFCIESGPAAGVVGAALLAARNDLGDIIVFDMGGTTAKATIVEDGVVLRSQEYEVGAGLNVGHRLLRGAGHILSVPAIDIAEVGAGGGSISAVDEAGSLRVGPESASSVPGPACYGRGGTHATVTDANVMLGYLNPGSLLGGRFRLDKSAAVSAVENDVAGPLKLETLEAAHGIHMLANSNMSRALRAVSSERGRDPRRFSLFAFGGGGPVHATGLADMLGMARVIVPPFPGVFSALGLLFPEIEHHLLRTSLMSVERGDVRQLQAVFDEMWADGDRLLADEGFDPDRRVLETSLDVRYEGQGSGLTIPLPAGAENLLEAIADAFDAEHERTFGHVTEAPHQITTVRVVARGLSKTDRIPAKLSSTQTLASNGTRTVYFGRHVGAVETPLISRSALSGTPRQGPLLIEEYDSTTVVPPAWTASIDAAQNIILEKA